jgi:hypothetical protein
VTPAGPRVIRPVRQGIVAVAGRSQAAGAGWAVFYNSGKTAVAFGERPGVGLAGWLRAGAGWLGVAGGRLTTSAGRGSFLAPPWPSCAVALAKDWPTSAHL